MAAISVVSVEVSNYSYHNFIFWCGAYGYWNNSHQLAIGRIHPAERGAVETQRLAALAVTVFLHPSGVGLIVVLQMQRYGLFDLIRKISRSFPLSGMYGVHSWEYGCFI